MINLKYKIWCRKSRKWEKQNIAVLPSGVMFHIKSKRIASTDEYVLCEIMNTKDSNQVEYFHGCVVLNSETNEVFIIKHENNQWLAQYEDGSMVNCIEVLYDSCTIMGHVWDREHSKMREYVESSFVD